MITIGQRHFSDRAWTLAIISLHAVARRFQRGGSDPREVLSDLVDLAAAEMDKIMEKPDAGIAAAAEPWKSDAITVDGEAVAGVRAYVD